MLTATEVKKENLPPGSFQINTKTGKIEPVGREPLVKIDTGSKPESKYQERVAEEAAKQDIETVTAANKAPSDLAKVNRTLRELTSSKAITGLGAETFTNIERVKGLFGDVAARQKVSDTEVLDALLGADVFPQIGALGIGARGLDTPSEREFLRQVMTGTTTMDRKALIKMTEIRRDLQEENIKQYNERIESGELDSFFETTKRPKKLLPLTDEQERRIQRRRQERLEPSQERRAARPGAPTSAPATPGIKSIDDILREVGVLR